MENREHWPSAGSSGLAPPVHSKHRIEYPSLSFGVMAERCQTSRTLAGFRPMRPHPVKDAAAAWSVCTGRFRPAISPCPGVAALHGVASSQMCVRLVGPHIAFRVTRAPSLLPGQQRPKPGNNAAGLGTHTYAIVKELRSKPPGACMPPRRVTCDTRRTLALKSAPCCCSPYPHAAAAVSRFCERKPKALLHRRGLAAPAAASPLAGRTPAPPQALRKRATASCPALTAFAA
jgi:hypothetical protein